MTKSLEQASIDLDVAINRLEAAVGQVTRRAAPLADDELRQRLSWFERREHLVRALAGAVEDTMVHELGEWRALVDWEMENNP